MSSQMITVWLLQIQEEAEAGVVFSQRHGAICPACNQRAKIYSTRPWEGSVRIRYHRCSNPQCFLCRAGKTIKSVEEDVTGVETA